MREKKKETIGIISISSKGTGYVKSKDYSEDIEVNHEKLNTALNGDTVGLFVYSNGKNFYGEVLKIIFRSKKGFSGILEKEKGEYFLKPDDIKMYTDILIPRKFLNGAKNGEKVYAEIILWDDKMKNPEGKIKKILGKPGNNNAEMQAIAIEKGFDTEFDKKIEIEAQKIKKIGIKKEDLKNRRDFRKIPTFTIDPEDAKDFDDAISIREIQNGEYEIGIHIADVSHYLKIGSEIDKEARNRGTSVYLVDRTIPMLPEILSNDLCSLLPQKDRLTMSAVFIIDKNAQIKNEWYGKTIINSIKRFTYEEAEKTIHNKDLLWHKELDTLNKLAKIFNRERFANGAISLEQEEVKFVLDKDGKPKRVIKKERGDSNKMIEEFMLLANKKVAEKISKKTKNRAFIYRIHDNPSKEKIIELTYFLKSLGYNMPSKKGELSKKYINELLKNITNKNEKDIIHRAVIRSMSKAIYSTKNIGHFGLSFEFYTHFTSPIRRYPDIVVHRILNNFLYDKKVETKNIEIYEKISREASEKERNATEAERNSIKYKQVEYMSSHIGEIFEGVISGVTEWGLYIEEKETKSEGLVKMRDMKDDYYIFNEKKLEITGQRKRKKYRFGDTVKIKVKNTDLERKNIDYLIY